MISGIKLDHVAVAVEKWEDAFDVFIRTLGGEWRSGGENIGFAPAQIAFKNDMRLEILRPANIEHNDFLRRFLDANGPGVHHLTFKVKDLASALDDVRSLGFNPIGVSLENAWWKEAFIHPKEAFGIVVQLAQAAGTWFVPPPAGFMMPDEGVESDLTCVTQAVKSLDPALLLFRDLLGGDIVEQTSTSNFESVDLVWPGPGKIRLLSPKSSSNQLDSFIGNRTGRNLYIEFQVKDPDLYPEAALSELPGHEKKSFLIPKSSSLGVDVVLIGRNTN